MISIHLRVVLLLATVLVLSRAPILDVDSSALAMQPHRHILANGNSPTPLTSLEGYGWLPLGNGTNGGIYALVTDASGNVYVGGSFTSAGGINAQIAKWNGSNWSAIGSGMDGNIYDLTIDDNGKLYATFFSNAGGILRSGISEWNSNSWVTIGEVTDGVVWVLATDSDGNLYAGGEFDQINNTNASNVAKWSGSTWTALGSGINSSVYALTTDTSGNLFAGGSFSQAGGEPANSIAKWNGTMWSALDSGAGSGAVHDLVVDQSGKLYAASYVGVSIWNGNTWEALDSWSNPQALALDENNNLYGSFYDFTVDGIGSFYSVRKWQDNGWIKLGSVLGYMDGISYQGHKLYVSGSFSTIEGVSAENIAMLVPKTFSDVSLDHWAYSYIEDLYLSGITGGCNTNPMMYCPGNTVTRAQMAIFLLRGIYGSSYVPPDVNGDSGFADIPANSPFAPWIKQLAVEGITGGCGNGNYCPTDPVSRAQMAIFLLRAEHGSKYAPPAATGVFLDVPKTDFTTPWIEQLANEAITGGCGGGNYCPGKPVTRDQMAVFLVRTFKLP